MRNIKKILAILVVFGMLFSSSCIWQERKIDKYDTYVCYDPNLSYLKADPFIEGKYSEGYSTETVYYRQIKGVDSDQFVLGLYLAYDFLWDVETARRYVFQKNENYFPVIDTWTISDMQLCLEKYEDSARGQSPPYIPINQNLPSKNGKKVVGEYEDLISEFQEVRENGESPEQEFLCDEWALGSGAPKDVNKTRDKLYLRITFEESKNIVWEAPVFCNIVDGVWQISVRLTYPEQEAEELDPNDPLNLHGVDYGFKKTIPQDSELYKRISEYADLLVEKHK